MKKIALMVALALLVSVGGVYATWRYSTAEVTGLELDLSSKLSITTIDSTNDSKGSISAPNSLVLTIDDDNGDHKPGWDADIADAAGSLTVKFTPNTGASATKFKYYLTISNYTYTCATLGDVSIFAPVDADDSITGVQLFSGELDYAGGPDAVSTEFSAAQVQSLLNLNTTITLDSIGEYNTYSAAVNNVQLVLYVEEVVAP